jgi:hypothetical protein
MRGSSHKLSFGTGAFSQPSRGAIHCFLAHAAVRELLISFCPAFDVRPTSRRLLSCESKARNKTHAHVKSTASDDLARAAHVLGLDGQLERVGNKGGSVKFQQRSVGRDVSNHAVYNLSRHHGASVFENRWHGARRLSVIGRCLKTINRSSCVNSEANPAGPLKSPRCRSRRVRAAFDASVSRDAARP